MSLRDLDDADIDKLFCAIFADIDFWTHTLADGRTVRAIFLDMRWVVSLWFQGEMLTLWEVPVGQA